MPANGKQFAEDNCFGESNRRHCHKGVRRPKQMTEIDGSSYKHRSHLAVKFTGSPPEFLYPIAQDIAGIQVACSVHGKVVIPRALAFIMAASSEP